MALVGLVDDDDVLVLELGPGTGLEDEAGVELGVLHKIGARNLAELFAVLPVELEPSAD